MSQELWGKPYNPNPGALPVDGEYYGQIGQPEVKVTQNGKELFIAPIQVTEGVYAGEKVEITFFYQTDGGMNALKGLIFKTDKRILDLQNLDIALTALISGLAGRKVKIKQNTNERGCFKEIVEVYEAPLVDLVTPENKSIAF